MTNSAGTYQAKIMGAGQFIVVVKSSTEGKPPNLLDVFGALREFYEGSK